jgi:hypothetical protein
METTKLLYAWCISIKEALLWFGRYILVSCPGITGDQLASVSVVTLRFPRLSPAPAADAASKLIEIIDIK